MSSSDILRVMAKAEHERLQKIAVLAERERAARLCEVLAIMWESRADKLEAEGSYRPWGIFKPVCAPKWKKAAEGTRAAAHGLRTVARGIRENWAPIADTDPDEKISMPAPDPLWEDSSD